MDRLTKKDWEIINTALALAEAEADGDDRDDDKWEISDVRVKVWQRLDKLNPGWRD